MIIFTLLIMNTPEGRNISHHKILNFSIFTTWCAATSNPAMDPSNGICVMKATKQKLCIALRTMQRRKLTSIWTAGTLLWRGHADIGNHCSLPCTTSKTVLCCLSHTACLQRTAKNGIGKYATYKLYTLLFSSYMIMYYWSYSGLKS